MVVAENAELLSGGVDAWSMPARVSRCPVHVPIQPSTADVGSGMTFAINGGGNTAYSGKLFSLLEASVQEGVLKSIEDPFIGLQINFTSIGLRSWKLRLYDGQSNMRFISVIDKPDGFVSLQLAWSAFSGEALHGTHHYKSCQASNSCRSINPESISTLAVLLQHATQASQLTIHSIRGILSSGTIASATSPQVPRSQSSLPVGSTTKSAATPARLPSPASPLPDHTKPDSAPSRQSEFEGGTTASKARMHSLRCLPMAVGLCFLLMALNL